MRLFLSPAGARISAELSLPPYWKETRSAPGPDGFSGDTHRNSDVAAGLGLTCRNAERQAHDSIRREKGILPETSIAQAIESISIKNRVTEGELPSIPQ
jgi:hypothetical protein